MWEQLRGEFGYMARDLRSLITVTFQAAHRVSESALDLERSPGLRKVRFYGVQVADAGVSTLAHVACATASLPAWDLQSRLDARNGLNGARRSLDTLRRLVRSCESAGYIGEGQAKQMLIDIDEAMALVRALYVEVHGSAWRAA